MQKHALVPRIYWGPNPRGLLGTNTNNTNNNTRGPRKADHVSLWDKRAACTEHFTPTNTQSVFPIGEQHANL